MSSTYKNGLLSTRTTYDNASDSYDVVITFHSAENLPKINIFGHTDLYFVAKIDDQISFISTILSNTSTVKWNNEKWIVRNIPFNAKLIVRIYNKEDGKFVDDFIGEFEIPNMINYRAPLHGHVILGSFNRYNGYFHLSIDSIKSSKESEQLPPYTLDGPCQYFRYDCLPNDHLTMINDDDDINSTWKIQLRRISLYFPPNKHQQYKSTRDTLDNYPFSVNTHKVFFERILKHNESGQLNSSDDLWKFIFLDRKTQRIKPRIFTYIIDNHTWQFTETVHHFFGDTATKHAVLAKYSECLCYAGEFHLRLKFGWNRLDDEWEIVFDNASGTFSPNADLLINLKNLLLFNFPGLNVIIYSYKDPMLKESIEQVELAAKKYRYSKTTSSTSSTINFR